MKFIVVAAFSAIAALQSPDPAAIAAKLHTYLLAYEPNLSELIADESMRQQTDHALSSLIDNRARRVQRNLTSEVAFIALPANAGWLGFRRVMMVGRDPVKDGTGSLKDVLSGGEKTDYAKAKEMLADSARFNLGEPRTINLPNLPLEMLHPRHAKRFSVRIAGKQRVRGHNTTLLVFVETFTPTIIKAADGGDMRSIVKAWVETANGRLWRGEVITRDTRPGVAPFDNLVGVEFSEHGTLGLLVPTKMKEEFYGGPNGRAWGEATYTNYRRFQTSARILPQ
jgi:hypothetical protein